MKKDTIETMALLGAMGVLLAGMTWLGIVGGKARREREEAAKT